MNNIDHIGIVVKDINDGINQWKNIFKYQQMTEIVINSKQKVKVVFMKKADSCLIKLISPVDESSPIYKIAKRGGGLHHLCFKTDNIANELNNIDDPKLRVLSPPQSGEAFENEDIAFLYAGNGLNIELIDTNKKAKIL